MHYGIIIAASLPVLIILMIIFSGSGAPTLMEALKHIIAWILGIGAGILLLFSYSAIASATGFQAYQLGALPGTLIMLGLAWSAIWLIKCVIKFITRKLLPGKLEEDEELS
jgi:hypothetical protein